MTEQSSKKGVVAEWTQLPDVQQFFGKTKPIDATTSAPEVTLSRDIVAPQPEDQGDILKPRSVEEKYLDSLKEFDLNREEAAKIVDSIITKMFWEEDVRVTKKLTISLRTRTSKVLKNLNDGLSKMNPQYDNTFYGVVAQYNLASSLTRYGSHIFDPEKDFEKSLDFVERVPGPLFTLLTQKLVKFDKKIEAVMKDGYTENF